MADSSPSIEERELVAGIGCLSNISKMGNMSIETKIRMGNIMIRPVASFGCQIWGANFLELNKALHCCLESVHTVLENGARGGKQSRSGCVAS